MIKKSFLGGLVLAGIMALSLPSCNNSSNLVYADDFVNSLVALKSLTPSNSQYVFTETFIDKATEYTYSLTCSEDNSYGYTFSSKLAKKISSGDISGYVYSEVDFLWARFNTSLFEGKADLISGSSETIPIYNFYGLVYGNDGTLKNTCYYKTYRSIDSKFSSIDVVGDSWNMTMIQVAHLNALCKECVNDYVW